MILLALCSETTLTPGRIWPENHHSNGLTLIVSEGTNPDHSPSSPGRPALP
jgi:hypothetical protein